MKTRHNMFYIAATISLAIMLTITPIIIGKAYSVEYSGQTANTGNHVTSEWITMDYFTTTNGTDFTEWTGEITTSPEITYIEQETRNVVNQTYSLTPSDLYIRITEHTSITSTQYGMNANVNFTSGVENTDSINTIFNLYTVSYGAQENIIKTPVETISPNQYYLMELNIDFNNTILNNTDLSCSISLTVHDKSIDPHQMNAGHYKSEVYQAKLQFSSDTAKEILEGISDPNYTVIEGDDGEIFITHVDSLDNSIASTNGGIALTIDNLSNIKFYIHVTMEATNNGAANNTSLTVKCTISDSGNTSSITLTAKKGNTVGIDEHIGYEKNNLTSVESTNMEKGINCFDITSGQTLKIELVGAEHNHALVKVSIIPYTSDSTTS